MQENSSKNFRVHVTSLSFTKLADGLINPKLVLSWLLTSLGASAFWIGLLVPVREAGSLLPQLFTAERVRSVPIRKWWWVTGSVVQGLAVIGMIVSILLTSGDTAGVLVVSFLALLALARSICSVSYKDVLGKTVAKSRRGDATGTAASIAAAGILLFGLLLMFELTDRMELVISALVLAASLWLLAALSFSRLDEAASQIASSTKRALVETYVGYLRHDKELRLFLLVRGLLVATAIAPPFLILLAAVGAGNALNQLGALVVASSFSTLLSGKIWGKLSDRSTVAVLSYAGLAGGMALLAAVTAATMGFFAHPLVLPVILFVLMTSYEGVRIARSIHLVNLANEETRAGYTAISNTIIGLVLLATGVFGAVAELYGITFTVFVLAIMSVLGGLLARSLQLP